MALTTEEFIAAFFALAGDTIGERRKNLFDLLKSNPKSSFDLSQLRPQTLFDQNLKFEVLNFYKDKNQLLEMLKEENPVVIEKILKLDWFMKEFESMDPNSLVTDIFPRLSYNSKIKLLHKLCPLLKDVSKCDEYFSVVQKVYGTYLAAKLLPTCSRDVIVKTMESKRVELTPKQLLLMIQRNPSLTEEILDTLQSYDSKIDIGNKYKYVFKYLIHNDLPTFLSLNEKYSSSFSLGNRTTRKFIANNKDICLKYPDALRKILKENQLAQCLNESFSEFFSQVFPRSLQKLINEFDCIKSLFGNLKDENKFNLLVETFEKHFDGDLLEHHELMFPEIFEWMPLDYKENWMEKTLKPKEIPEETWISFMGIKKSLPLLKDKILLTSNVKERERLVKALVKTCKINKDEDALEEVCEYMFDKHRNDHSIVRQAFLEAVMTTFDLKKLSEKHWKRLNEFLRPMCETRDSYWICTQYLTEYIRFGFDKNLPVSEYIKLWFQQTYCSYYIFCEKPKYKKRVLELAPEVLPLCYKDDELKEQQLSFMYELSRWNKLYPKDQISPFDYKDMMDVLVQTLDSSQESYSAWQAAIHCIAFDFEKASELGIPEKLLKSKNTCSVDIKRLLKHYSSDIISLIPGLIQNAVKEPVSSRNLREYYTLVLNQKVTDAIISTCKEIVKTGTDDAKTRAMFILSVMLTPKDFLQYIQEHRPTDDSISKFQQQIPNSLKNIIPAHCALSSVLEYCQGDYMKCTQNALHRVCNNVAENRLEDVITALSTRPVSVRKHSFILALRLLNNTSINALIKTFMANETNQSLRKNLFKSIFNLFLRNPDDHLWQLVKENIGTIAPDDIEAFCKLTDSKRIPKAFFVQYITFAWETLNNLPYNDKLEEGKCRILEAVTADNVVLLPNDFCLELIRNNLFQKTHPKLQNELHVFAAKYLIYSSGSVVDETFSIIKRFFKVSSKMVYAFVQEFCRIFLEKKCEKVDVLTMFITAWNKTLKPSEALEDYIYLTLTSLLVECRKKKSVEEVGGRIAKVCNDLFDSHSLDVLIFQEVFVNCFKDRFLEEAEGNMDENNLLIIDSIVKRGNSNACLSLAVALLPSDTALTSKVKLTYDSVLEAAGQNSHPLVQIQLHRYLINK